VIELMKRMRDEFGTTFVFSTHDPRIMDQAETLFHLEDGRLLDAIPRTVRRWAMLKVTRLAIKNLLRYKRRSLLTGLLIAFGVVAVIVFVGLAAPSSRPWWARSPIRSSAICRCTARATWPASTTCPWTACCRPRRIRSCRASWTDDPGVEAFSPRIKFGAMLSNYAQTTNVRLNGIDPAKEAATAPLLAPGSKTRPTPRCS
jgi:putative ABC transport system permease protein